MPQRPCVIINLIIPVPKENNRIPTPETAREFLVKVVEQIKPADVFECRAYMDMMDIKNLIPLHIV